MKKLLLIALFLLSGHTAYGATVYYADPNGSGSSCTQGTPCTFTQCTSTATTGDTCSLNAGTYDLGSSGVNLTKNITYTSTGSACSAIITSTNTTRTMGLNPANNSTPLIVQNVSINGDSAQNVVQIGDQAFDAEAQITGNCITNGGTIRHIADFWTRGTVKITNNTLTGTIGSAGAIYTSVTPSGSGKKQVITGNTITATMSQNSAIPAIYVGRVVASTIPFWGYVASNTLNITAPSSLGSSASIYGIRIDRIATGTSINGDIQPMIVEYNTVTVTATGGTVNDTDAIMASASESQATSYGVIIRNNTVTCNSPVTRCISVGADASTPSFIDSARVYNNKVYGTYYNGSATPHGISCGSVNDCQVYSNYVQGSSASILSGVGTNAKIFSNIINGGVYAGLLAKGNISATFANNLVVMDDSILGAKIGNYGCIGVASQGATNTIATTFVNNTCFVNSKSSTAWKFTQVDPSQTATFLTNNYFAVPTLTTTFSHQGTGYATVDDWNALANVEGETNVNPNIRGGQTPPVTANLEQFKFGYSTINSNGTVLRSFPYDFRGRSFGSNPTRGAFQYGYRDFTSRN